MEEDKEKGREQGKREKERRTNSRIGSKFHRRDLLDFVPYLVTEENVRFGKLEITTTHQRRMALEKTIRFPPFDFDFTSGLFRGRTRESRVSVFKKRKWKEKRATTTRQEEVSKTSRRRANRLDLPSLVRTFLRIRSSSLSSRFLRASPYETSLTKTKFLFRDRRTSHSLGGVFGESSECLLDRSSSDRSRTFESLRIVGHGRSFDTL